MPSSCVETEDSDVEVEVEFKSRRVAASEAGRGEEWQRQHNLGREGVGGARKKQCHPVAEVKQNVTTRNFIEESKVLGSQERG